MLRVGLILPAGFHVMSYATLATFDTANFIAGEQIYDVSIISEHGGPVPNSFGMATETEPLDIKPFDTLLVGAGMAATPPTPKLLTFLREAVTDVRRIASICIGTFILAEAGILDGRRVTTHWAFAQELERRFPKVRVEMDRIFIADGPVWTSAGMTAGIDMALGLVERDMGGDIARATAKMMVVHHRRAGGQSQHSAMFELDAKSDRVQDALAFARNNLRQPLTVEQLAEAARLSPRQFARVFRTETGQSPARAVENLRLEAARYMLEQGRLPVEGIAQETGFGDVSGCAEASCAPSGKRPRPYATPPIHLQRYRRALALSLDLLAVHGGNRGINDLGRASRWRYLRFSARNAAGTIGRYPSDDVIVVAPGGLRSALATAVCFASRGSGSLFRVSAIGATHEDHGIARIDSIGGDARVHCGGLRQYNRDGAGW